MSWHKTRRDLADAAFSEWIRRRDKRCMHCGLPGTGEKGITGLDASHFMSRRYEGTRFEPLNTDALCRNCHRYFGEHRTEHEAWQIERKGQKIVDQLLLQAHTYHKKNRQLEKVYWLNELKKLDSISP